MTYYIGDMFMTYPAIKPIKQDNPIIEPYIIVIVNVTDNTITYYKKGNESELFVKTIKEFDEIQKERI